MKMGWEYFLKTCIHKPLMCLAALILIDEMDAGHLVCMVSSQILVELLIFLLL